MKKWPKFAFIEAKFPHLKFRVRRARVYTYRNNKYRLRQGAA